MKPIKSTCSFWWVWTIHKSLDLSDCLLSCKPKMPWPHCTKTNYILSIPVFPKMWDTELLCTEYARNYLLTWVPIDSSPRHLSVDWRWNNLARVLFDSSPRRLVVDRRWNYLARALVDSSHRRPSVDPLRNYLARVPVVCPSTDAETVGSHPISLSFYRLKL